MERRLANYLRTYRLHSGLTQPELARLLGIKSASHVSRLERGKREPTTPIIIACTVIFGGQVADIFPAIFAVIEEDVVRRAYEFYLDLQGKPGKTVKLKLDFIQALLDRAPAQRDEQFI
jgi:transcriptional regulator with XRE-family HTH domain